MSYTKRERKQFVFAYLECALWSSTAYGVPESIDNDSFDTSFESYGFTSDDIAPVAKISAFRDCLAFIDENAEAMEATGAAPEQHGHDFWLTRNRHGAGFWDRGYGKRGDALAESAKGYRSRDPYVGDDGKLYGF